MGTSKNRLAEAVLTCTHNLCFEKNIKIFSWNFQFFKAQKSLCFAWASFRNVVPRDTDTTLLGLLSFGSNMVVFINDLETGIFRE